MGITYIKKSLDNKILKSLKWTHFKPLYILNKSIKVIINLKNGLNLCFKCLQTTSIEITVMLNQAGNVYIFIICNTYSLVKC